MRRMKYRRLANVLAPLFLIAIAGFSTSHADSFATQVSASADDARVYGSIMETASSDALVGYTGYYHCDFLARFGDILVPQDATVDSAFLIMRASSSQSGTVCSGVVYAENTAAADAFSTYADYANRAVTDNSVDWYDFPPLASGDWLRSPDIRDVVGEIVGRPDWVEGNALALFIRDNNSSSGAVRRFSAYDSNSAYACSLLVYYSVSTAEPEVIPRRRRVTE